MSLPLQKNIIHIKRMKYRVTQNKKKHAKSSFPYTASLHHTMNR